MSRNSLQQRMPAFLREPVVAALIVSLTLISNVNSVSVEFHGGRQRGARLFLNTSANQSVTVIRRLCQSQFSITW